MALPHYNRPVIFQEIYIGDPNINGSYKITTNEANQLVIFQRIADEWIEQGKFGGE